MKSIIGMTLLLAGATLSSPVTDVPHPPGGSHSIFNETLRGSLDIQEITNRITNFPITSHGGPVMAAPVTYIIWYGTWTAAAQSIITTFVSGVGTTPWWAINKAYGVGNLVYKSAVSDATYSQGKTLTTQKVWNVVVNAINTKGLPANTNAIYLVLSSSDVAQSGFCTNFCGWHTYAGSYKFAWVGVAPSGCNCLAQTTSPNGNAAVDAAVSVIAHELAEAATDPLLNGWCYSNGQPTCSSGGAVENADQCAWYFPNSVKLTSGAYYNLIIGSKKYLVQANWNLGSKACTMS